MLCTQPHHRQQLTANSRLKQFTVHHYNHPVKYDADGFVERNKDKLHTSVAKLLGTSTNNMVKRCDSTSIKSTLNSLANPSSANNFKRTAPRLNLLFFSSLGCSYRVYAYTSDGEDDNEGGGEAAKPAQNDFKARLAMFKQKETGTTSGEAM